MSGSSLSSRLHRPASPCEGAGDGKRKGEVMKKGREVAGSKGQPHLADYQPIRWCPALRRRQQRGKRGGGEKEEERSKESRRVDGPQGGSPGSIIPGKEVQ